MSDKTRMRLVEEYIRRLIGRSLTVFVWSFVLAGGMIVIVRLFGG